MPHPPSRKSVSCTLTKKQQQPNYTPSGLSTTYAYRYWGTFALTRGSQPGAAWAQDWRRLLSWGGRQPPPAPACRAARPPGRTVGPRRPVRECAGTGAVVHRHHVLMRNSRYRGCHQIDSEPIHPPCRIPLLRTLHLGLTVILTLSLMDELLPWAWRRTWALRRAPAACRGGDQTGLGHAGLQPRHHDKHRDRNNPVVAGHSEIHTYSDITGTHPNEWNGRNCPVEPDSFSRNRDAWRRSGRIWPRGRDGALIWIIPTSRQAPCVFKRIKELSRCSIWVMSTSRQAPRPQ